MSPVLFEAHDYCTMHYAYRESYVSNGSRHISYEAFFVVWRVYIEIVTRLNPNSLRFTPLEIFHLFHLLVIGFSLCRRFLLNGVFCHLWSAFTRVRWFHVLLKEFLSGEVVFFFEPSHGFVDPCRLSLTSPRASSPSHTSTFISYRPFSCTCLF